MLHIHISHGLCVKSIWELEYKIHLVIMSTLIYKNEEKENIVVESGEQTMLKTGRTCRAKGTPNSTQCHAQRYQSTTHKRYDVRNKNLHPIRVHRLNI